MQLQNVVESGIKCSSKDLKKMKYRILFDSFMTWIVLSWLDKLNPLAVFIIINSHWAGLCVISWRILIGNVMCWWSVNIEKGLSMRFQDSWTSMHNFTLHMETPFSSIIFEIKLRYLFKYETLFWKFAILSPLSRWKVSNLNILD